MSATLKAAVHLGQDDPQNLRTTNNTYFDQIKHFFNISRKLILNQEQEIHGISTIDWDTIHGKAAPCRTTKLSSRHRQKCTSSQIRYFVPEAGLPSTHDRWRLGKTKLIGPRNLQSIVKWTTLMENQPRSSGNSSQGTPY